MTSCVKASLKISSTHNYAHFQIDIFLSPVFRVQRTPFPHKKVLFRIFEQFNTLAFNTLWRSGKYKGNGAFLLWINYIVVLKQVKAEQINHKSFWQKVVLQKSDMLFYFLRYCWGLSHAINKLTIEDQRTVYLIFVQRRN